MIGLILAGGALALGVLTFRLQAQTQRTLIQTQITISSTWRTLRQEARALESDHQLRKLRRGLAVLRVLGFEWLIRPRAEQPEGSDRGQHN